MKFLAPGSPYTPERAYWYSVVPLGCLFAFGGVLMAVIACVPFTQFGWLPFLHTDASKRVALIIIAVPFTVVGIGLWRRSKLAWRAAIAYFCFGILFPVLSRWHDPTAVAEYSRNDLVVHTVFSLLISTGIYFATRPAFRTVVPPGQPDDRTVLPPR